MLASVYVRLLYACSVTAANVFVIAEVRRVFMARFVHAGRAFHYISVFHVLSFCGQLMSFYDYLIF